MPEPIVRLPAEAAQFIAGGGRDVDTAKLAVEVAAGESLRLVDDNGDEIGLAIADPDNARLRVMATPADGFPAIDGALLGWRVERALQWRKALGLPGADCAYRIVHGAGDGLPGFACDVLGATAVVYVYGAFVAQRFFDHPGFETVPGASGGTTVIVRARPRDGKDLHTVVYDVSRPDLLDFLETVTVSL